MAPVGGWDRAFRTRLEVPCWSLQEISIVPLQFERIHIGNHDPRFAAALQIDKHTFQQLVVDLDQIAVHYRNKYTPIFLHDTHRSRIDFIFLRAFQLQWRHLQPIVDCHFERIGLHQGA